MQTWIWLYYYDYYLISIVYTTTFLNRDITTRLSHLTRTEGCKYTDIVRT